MAVTMSEQEREMFLAGVHVGVLSVSRPGRGPLTVPVWYSYEPGGLVTVITGASSGKATLIGGAGRFSLCAQSEEPPYKYVSVEGPVTGAEAPVDPEETRAMAYRYLGREFGDLYLAATAEEAAANCAIRMRPQAWLSADFGKEYG
jgi:nitroimidazol reductase NimA-like FMN-containing flavoprotein (pyridoxamine 5'-phosphate oxidase superfamily)